MSKQIATNLLVLAGAILYNLIFWNEKFGINILIFTIFLLSSLWYLNKESFQERSVQLTAGGTLVLAILNVVNNSVISHFIYILSLAVCIGLIQKREIRFLVLAGFVYVFNFFQTPFHLMRGLVDLPILRGKHSLAKSVKLGLISLLILPVFYGLYYVANPKFADIANRFWDTFFKWFTFDWDWERIFFSLFGLMVVGAALYKHLSDFIAEKDRENSLTLDATEYEDEEKKFSIFDMDEKSSYNSAVILLGLLNVLLFFNNILDFTYVWLGDNVLKSAVELKQYVHEGTFFLIAALLLAIVVIMFLFKGKVNFLENTKILRGLAYAWIGQNAFLALSVGMRNWQYIDHYGLAYLRIGVVLFLILVMYGLYLMYQKIKDKRTIFYFLTRGAWGLYFVMVAHCFINWDIFITRYNINTDTKSHSVDVPFLIREISPKNIYLLYENRAKLIEKMPTKPFEKERYWENDVPTFANDSLKIAYLDAKIEAKKARFLNNQKQLSWWSWNYPDYVNLQYLSKNKN